MLRKIKILTKWILLLGIIASNGLFSPILSEQVLTNPSEIKLSILDNSMLAQVPHSSSAEFLGKGKGVITTEIEGSNQQIHQLSNQKPSKCIALPLLFFELEGEEEEEEREKTKPVVKHIKLVFDCLPLIFGLESVFDLVNYNSSSFLSYNTWQEQTTAPDSYLVFQQFRL